MRAGGPPGGGFGGGGIGGEGQSLTQVLNYVKAHGGGTIGVSSQTAASASVISSGADVAGLGGFSGRESSVSVSWLATEVGAGHLRWVIAGGSQSPRVSGDTRQGSQAAMDVVAKVCRPVTVGSSTSTGTTMYDCQGRAAAILATTKS
jgi:hypothetical protein